MPDAGLGGVTSVSLPADFGNVELAVAGASQEGLPLGIGKCEGRARAVQGVADPNHVSADRHLEAVAVGLGCRALAPYLVS
jgi:hypothetical protein